MITLEQVKQARAEYLRLKKQYTKQKKQTIAAHKAQRKIESREKAKQAHDLYQKDGNTFAKVAEIMGISANHARTLKYRREYQLNRGIQ